MENWISHEKTLPSQLWDSPHASPSHRPDILAEPSGLRRRRKGSGRNKRYLKSQDYSLFFKHLRITITCLKILGLFTFFQTSENHCRLYSVFLNNSISRSTVSRLTTVPWCLFASGTCPKPHKNVCTADVGHTVQQVISHFASLLLNWWHHILVYQIVYHIYIYIYIHMIRYTDSADI